MKTTLRTLTVLAGLLLPVTALADIDADQTFRALGAPEDPKVVVSWNRFYDVEGLMSIIKQLNKAYPDLSRLVKLGESEQGREIWAIEITNYKKGEAATKSGMYIDGNIHGNEVQGGDVVAYTAWYLLEMYGKVESVTKLLDEHVFYLVPTINPDGRDSWFHGPSNPHLNRGGNKPVDDDGDGRFDEDPVDDMDGDGHITSMRVRDEWGRWKADPDFPDTLMIRAKPEEKGEFTRLEWEGFDNDGDGEINEDGPGGYDPNRNWPWDWAPEGIQYGAHEYPFSLKETKAVRDYVMARPNIAGMQSYHNAAGMILRGPGVEGSDYERQDENVMREISQKGEQMLPGYKAAISWKDLYTVYGGEFEWFYAGLGVMGFTNEMFTNDNYYRRPQADGTEGNREEARFMKYLLMNQGVTPWKAFEHPDLGPIEIGGTHKEFGRVPPSFMLEEELHRNMSFTLYHASMLPVLRIAATEVKDMGNGTYRVRAAIENTGMVPTRTKRDAAKGITPRNVVTVEGKNAQVLASGVVTDRLQDRVEWQEHRPARLMLESVEGMRAAWVEFLVKGSGNVTVKVEALKGGIAEAEVPLEQK